MTQTATLTSAQTEQLVPARPLAAGLQLAWLTLREPADAAARSRRLITIAADLLAGAPDRPAIIHDLGAGSGSMMRWAAPLLPGPQHWVLHDRDPDLLAAATTPGPGVTVETRLGDLADVDPAQFGDASLITASALLDMFTADRLDRLLATVAQARCPVLIALSVTGRASLDPAEPEIDDRFAWAFDDHQRRLLPDADGRGPDHRLGPDAAERAAARLTAAGLTVTMAATPWRLDSVFDAGRDLLGAWLDGWVAAAVEQQPDLAGLLPGWLERRHAQLAAGRLRAVIPHADLLAVPLIGPHPEQPLNPAAGCLV
jgi:hypothetical protein